MNEKNQLNTLEVISNLQQQMHDALRPMAEMQKQIAAAIEPLKGFQERFNEIGKQIVRSPFLDQIQNISKQYLETQKRFGEFAKNIKPLIPDISEIVENLTVIVRQSNSLKESGYLPHLTVPMNLVDEYGSDPNLLSEKIEIFYRNEWKTMEQKLLSRAESYLIDQETKETFAEALAGHRDGRYRSVVSLLFPALERAVNSNETLREFGKANNLKSAGIILKRVAAELSPAEIEPRGYIGLELFDRLADHLFIPFHGEKDRERMTIDHVPNRNAALHGVVIYKSFKNSLNMLFMADYIFQIISIVERESREEELNKSEFGGH